MSTTDKYRPVQISKRQTANPTKDMSNREHTKQDRVDPEPNKPQSSIIGATRLNI